MKKFLFLLAFAFCTLAGFGAFVKHHVIEGGDGAGPRSADHRKTPNDQASNTVESKGGLAALGPFSAEGQAPVVQGPTLASIEMPSVDGIRSEIQADPHATPKSLEVFAQAFAEHMTAAMNDRVYAKQVFAYLESCVKGAGKAPATVRVYCLKNSERIEARYPEAFAGRSAKLERALPNDLQMLAKNL